ncbi:MAG: hypothetical protein Q8P67_02760, partial [archaeon]|nr:hypothetical protein [archaeon]
VQQLLDVNEMLLAELETRITQDWHDQQVLGDIFVKFVPFLKMYTIYSSSYDEGLQIYLKMKKSDSKFSHALDEAQAAGKEKMDLEHLLIMPVQRVPRYNLLLRDLRKMTPVAHPEWPLLNKALAQTLEVSKHINIGIRQAENLKVLAGASSRGKGFTSLLESHRQLIRDVVLTATSKAVGYQIEQPSDSSSSSGSSGLSSFFRSGTQKVHFYLFNDLFLWAPEGEIQKQKDISKVSESAPLNLLWIFKKKKGIEVIVPGQSFTFKFENNAQKTAWEKDFDQTCGSFLNTHSTAQTNLERNTHPLTHASEWRWAAGVLIDGGTYDGWFHNGARSGQGHYNIMGNDYHGEWLGGRRHGQGTATYFTGDSYTGQWADNQPHGHGVWTGSSGDTYVGEHRANLRHGKGTFTWASGDVYEGDWVAGQANGRGKYRLKSGLFYEGHFENSRFHGQGKLSLPSNLNYAGFWKNGRRHGQGQCDFGNGTMYNGDWVDDLPSGKGAYVSQWANARFAGTWQAGVRHGKKCTMVYGDGSTYLGDFKDDLRSGKGEYLLPNGTSVSGKWRNDKLHGNCIVQYKNGVKLEGLWENGFREGKFALTNVIDTSVSPSSSSSSSPAVLPPITLVFRHSQLISHPAEAFSAAAPIHPPTFTINPIQTFFSFTGAGISSW